MFRFDVCAHNSLTSFPAPGKLILVLILKFYHFPINQTPNGQTSTRMSCHRNKKNTDNFKEAERQKDSFTKRLLTTRLVGCESHVGKVIVQGWVRSFSLAYLLAMGLFESRLPLTGAWQPSLLFVLEYDRNEIFSLKTYFIEYNYF